MGNNKTNDKNNTNNSKTISKVKILSRIKSSTWDDIFDGLGKIYLIVDIIDSLNFLF